MKKTIKLPELSAEESHRLVEVKMFLLVERIFKVMGDKTTTQDFIDILCTVSDTSINLVKTVITNMRSANTTIAPHKSEIAVMLYRSNKPVSEICRLIDISPNTVYNWISSYYKIKDREYLPKIKPEYFSQIEKFTRLVGELLYDEHYIR